MTSSQRADVTDEGLKPAPVPSIFEFEATTLYAPDKAARALQEHPEVYINHLTIARHLEQWAEGLDGDSPQIFGFKDGLLDVAAHLRQADYLPGSPELNG